MAEAVGERLAVSRPLWVDASIACLVFVVAVLFLYGETAVSITSIWSRSDTYAHGYLIVPLSLWLVWHMRDELAPALLRPTFLPAMLIVPGGFAWLLAHLVDVLVVQQLALVGVLIVGIWAIVGHAIARQIAFPLGFLLLAVPMGEDLVPPMMDLTAATTVWLVKMTGIPVYREGLYFTLPSGNWSVVEACSGVRYLIASFTLGLLYAHLSYRSLGRKLLFVLASILVPVVANTLRAYIIVMLGHLSDMKVATGVDHLLYGWVFFGLVMMLLFWVGSWWREDEQEVERTAPVAKAEMHTTAIGGFVGVTLAAILLAGAWPLLAHAIDSRDGDATGTSLVAPGAAGDWTPQPAPEWNWEPIDRGADATLTQFYQGRDSTLALYVHRFINDSEGGELVSGKVDQMISEEAGWRITASRDLPAARTGGLGFQVREVEVAYGGQSLLIWYWYRIGERDTVNRYRAKIYQAIEAVTFGRRDSALLLISTELQVGEDALSVARGELSDFVLAQRKAIKKSLNGTVAVGGNG